VLVFTPLSLPIVNTLDVGAVLFQIVLSVAAAFVRFKYSDFVQPVAEL